MAARKLAVAAALIALSSTHRSNAFTSVALTTRRNKLFAKNAAKIISGSPSDEARAIDPREAILQSSVKRLDGTTVTLSSLLPDKNAVSLVVVTRSFG